MGSPFPRSSLGPLPRTTLRPLPSTTLLSPRTAAVAEAVDVEVLRERARHEVARLEREAEDAVREAARRAPARAQQVASDRVRSEVLSRTPERLRPQVQQRLDQHLPADPYAVPGPVAPPRRRGARAQRGKGARAGAQAFLVPLAFLAFVLLQAIFGD